MDNLFHLEDDHSYYYSFSPTSCLINGPSDLLKISAYNNILKKVWTLFHNRPSLAQHKLFFFILSLYPVVSGFSTKISLSGLEALLLLRLNTVLTSLDHWMIKGHWKFFFVLLWSLVTMNWVGVANDEDDGEHVYRTEFRVCPRDQRRWWMDGGQLSRSCTIIVRFI